ncbi:MAG TPA: acyltransferase [Kiritimatiellia bacterium]|nr:acyltransferase [Kiritimatiellia bacterium]
MSEQQNSYKVKSLGEENGGSSAWRKYRDLVHGDVSNARVLFSELVTFLIGGFPGPLGLFLRSKIFPKLFGACGSKVVFGRNVVLRHAHKIRLGDRVVVDDYAVLDAKGRENRGIEIGDDVYIGRNTIIYCKGGDIVLENAVNISSNCQIFSSNRLEIGAGTVIGAFTYLLSGGEYDHEDPTPFAKQSGMKTKGPLRIGANSWLGARVTVLDAATVGDHCVLAAGAVVNKPIPPDSIAGGVPAKVIKSIATGSKE